MSFITRGFTGRSRDHDPRLPPGQTRVEDWPVLWAGPTPVIRTDDWAFTITTEDGEVHRWDWDSFLGVGVEDIETDIHCVTHWSKLDDAVAGRVVGQALRRRRDRRRTSSWPTATAATRRTSRSTSSSTGRPGSPSRPRVSRSTPEHGGPARLLVPHLYFWKSAKWVRGLVMMPDDEPGFWEQYGYHLHGDPWLEERYW